MFPERVMTRRDAASFPVSVDLLTRHVATVAGEIGERHVGQPRQLTAAAQYLQTTWSTQGYRVTPYDYRVRGVPCANLEGDANRHTHRSRDRGGRALRFHRGEPWRQ